MILYSQSTVLHCTIVYCILYCIVLYCYIYLFLFSIFLLPPSVTDTTCKELKFESRAEGTEDYGHAPVPLHWLKVRQITKIRFSSNLPVTLLLSFFRRYFRQVARVATEHQISTRGCKWPGSHDTVHLQGQVCGMMVGRGPSRPVENVPFLGKNDNRSCFITRFQVQIDGIPETTTNLGKPRGGI